MRSQRLLGRILNFVHERIKREIRVVGHLEWNLEWLLTTGFTSKEGFCHIRFAYVAAAPLAAILIYTQAPR